MARIPCSRLNRQILLSVLSIGLMAGLAGCGGGKGDLNGTVKLKDKFVRSGSVLVLGSDGIPRSTLIQEDGSYSVSEVPVGEVRIAVNSPNPKPLMEAPPDKYGKRKLPPDNPNWFVIPEHYGDFEKSGITFKIQKGGNTFDIELE